MTNYQDALDLFHEWTLTDSLRRHGYAVEAAMALTPHDAIEAKYLPSFLLLSQPQHADFYQIPQHFTLQEAEKEIIRFTLEKTKGNKSKAARLLGIGLRTLQRKVLNA